MSKILVVHGSPRGERPHSRRLTERFVLAWQAAHPHCQLTRREVGRTVIPPVNEAFIVAALYHDTQARPLTLQAESAHRDPLVTVLRAHRPADGRGGKGSCRTRRTRWHHA